MLCVSIIQRRGEPRPHWKCSKVQLTLFSEAAISGSGCIIFVLFPLSRSLLISAADGDIKRSPVVKRPAHNWIIPQSENVGKPRKHFILTSCFLFSFLHSRSHLKISAEASLPIFAKLSKCYFCQNFPSLAVTISRPALVVTLCFSCDWHEEILAKY